MLLLSLSLPSHPSLCSASSVLLCPALLCLMRDMAADYLPFLAMFLVQLGYAGMNIFVKLAMDSGMNPFILIAYRQIIATVAMAPFAYFLERKRRPKITRAVLVQAFFCSIFGATLNQILYFIGLKHSNPTLGCAFNNLLPAMTFLLAVPCRVETVGIRTRAEQAKVLGTTVCIGGAMVLTFYRGHIINIGQSGIHWKYAEQLRTQDSQTQANFILGPLLLITSCVSWAIWFIIQGRMSEKFTAPYTSSTLMCFMASIECGVIALLVDHSPSAWALNDSIRLVSALYSAIVGTALAFCLMSWTIQRKGPLYVSVFSPLLLVIVAILSWALLGDNLHFGTVVGSIFVVLGLYAVLWGKGKEEDQRDSKEEAEDQGKELEDLEIQMNGKHYIKG